MGMSIGIALSPLALDRSGNAVDAAVAQARAAAAAGVGSVWLGQTFSHDALLVAAIVGREVPGIEVGTSVVPVPGRHPLLVASQAQTAQAATGGRFTLGLGLGARGETVTAAAPMPAAVAGAKPTVPVLVAAMGPQALRAADLVVLGDEENVAARVADYFAAGATDVVFSQTDLTTPEDQRRTWALLGELERAG